MHLKGIIKSRNILIFTAVLIISLSASYSVVYNAIQSFSNLEPGGNSDSLLYLSMYNSKTVQGHWRYRVVTPFLAKALPDMPSSLFNQKRIITDFWIAKVKFGIVNFFFLSLTGILFFYFLLSFGFSLTESLLGILLFYTARPVIQNSGAPMVEASAYFFLILCLYATRLGNLPLLAIGFSIGVFAKETIFLIFPAILLSQLKNKTKAIIYLLPATAAYLLSRFHIYPGAQETHLNLKYLLFPAGYQLNSLFRFNKLADLISSFGLLWLPALYALGERKIDLQIRKWSYLIIFVLVIILLLNVDGNFGRLLFMSFPIVIPLALYGIRSMVGKTAES